MSSPEKVHQYLFELGCEELPAGFLSTVERELSARLEAMFTELRLKHAGFQIYLTPRRIAFIVNELEGKQAASEEWVKGPPVSVGLDANGQVTPAALGFAKKQGIDAARLVEKEIDGTRYLSYLKQDSGRSVMELLAEVLPATVLSLPGSHFMRWDVIEEGVQDVLFSRPIRWVLSLLDNQHLPLSFGPLQSGTTSLGHRFLSDGAEIEIPSAEHYLASMEGQGSVLADHRLRQARIQAQLNALASEKKLVIPEQLELLEHVNFLVEFPQPILGGFDPNYLNLPEPVITTVMTAHQKYFHAYDAAGEKLIPGFITISNNSLEGAEATIRSGNEKVLRARLEDATFFFQEDRKKPLEGYVDALKGITFQKNLGTLYDKTQRLTALVPVIGQLMLAPDAVIQESTRAALLSKADLATLMVRELTELQGTIGQYYARLSGESEVVSQAINEHYLPRFSGDALPQSDVGTLLSLVDKLDTMLAVFSQKDLRLPTGSKDPMGLRRLCLGLIVTILERQVSINLLAALKASYANLGSIATLSFDETVEKFETFFLQRLKGYFLDLGYRFDLIEAVFAADESPLSELCLCQKRLEALKQCVENEAQLKQLYEPANRIAKMLGNQYNPSQQLSELSEGLLENDAEKAVFAVLKNQFDSCLAQADFMQKIAILTAWEPAVSDFFEKTLVNVDDAALKQNRYVLLSLLNKAYRSLADWTKLAV